MRKVTNRKLARSLEERVQLLLRGSHKKLGKLKTDCIKADPNDGDSWFVSLRCTSLHQLLMLYQFLWDRWLRTGRGFDEFRLIKDGTDYYAEISFVAYDECRLRVSVVTNKRTINAYETDKENNHSLFGYKSGTKLEKR